MASTTASTSTSTRMGDLSSGVIGGMVGGMVFGMMMQMMNAMPSIAMLVGSSSVAVGWVVHLMISALFGLLFAALLPGQVQTIGRAVAVGLAYGMVLWVGGALIAMPAKLGMPIMHFDTMAWQSLMGHMIYGVLLALVLRGLTRRRTSRPA